MAIQIERVWIHKATLKATRKDSRFLCVVRSDGEWLQCSFASEATK